MQQSLPKFRLMLIISIVIIIIAGCGNKYNSNASPESLASSSPSASEQVAASEQPSPSEEPQGYVPTELTVQFAIP